MTAPRERSTDERDYPYPNVRFLLEIEGLTTAGFSGCRLGASTTAVLSYRAGNEPPTPRKIPGTTDYEAITLERGVGDGTALADWRRLVERGQIAEARRSVAVVILDEGGEAGPRWEAENAWPSRYVGPRLDALDGAVAIEALEITHEGYERVRP
ncbi:phage tail protein [Salinirubellus salinus]|uniref:Phage tail protein n=1 Tax=Salinirubellus salinus TaxID=1364945 RepID=A0A9E7R2Y4_9EURY|nr:phage tail protein [Salinirubellus salinus]UWM53665.1 phage tail protein [Salinirubellus salinus]